MSRKKKSRDNSAKTAAEQRKTMAMMLDKLNAMRTPIDELAGMQTNMRNEQLGIFGDIFGQMFDAGTGLFENNPNMPAGHQMQPQQPMIQMPEMVQNQMAEAEAAQQQAAQPPQAPEPPWMQGLTPEQKAAVAKYRGMGPAGRR